MRLFIGIPLAEAAISELLAFSARLHSRDDGLRWSTPESWHITLQFLGNTSQEQYACIVAQLRELRSPPVSIQLESSGFFERAGIFFIGVQPAPELINLQKKVTAATAACGFAPETRPYHPHITLARSKGKEGMHALRRLKSRVHRQPFASFMAQNFLLYESFTRPDGAHYDVRERFLFNDIGTV